MARRTLQATRWGWLTGLAALLLVGGCGKDPTALRIIIQVSGLTLDQVALNGTLDAKTLFSNQRFPQPPASFASGSDVVILLSDDLDGRVLSLMVQGLYKAQLVAQSSAKATIRKNEQVAVTVKLGTGPTDGGPDLPRDRGPTDGPRDSIGSDGVIKDGKGLDLPISKEGVILPDKPGPGDKGCAVGTSTCDGSNIVTCVAGEAGPTLQVENCPLGCVPVKCRTLLPSNAIPSSLFSGASASLAPSSGIVIINSDSGKITGITVTPVYTVFSQGGGAPSIMAMAFKSIYIPKNVTVRVTGGNALALLASGTIEIEGVLDASGSGNTPGPGGGAGQTASSPAAGHGPGGSGGSVKTGFLGFYTVSGGGGASHAKSGGLGGNGQLQTYTSAGGLSGLTYGKAELVPLTGGSGGGRGGSTSSSDAASGGGGGGALQLVSNSGIIVGTASGQAGGITVGGGGGGASSNSFRGGGGGGSGGGLLLEAPAVTLYSGAVLAANGGGGGGGSGTSSSATSGQTGTLGSQQANGGQPSQNGGSGGGGAAGAYTSGSLGSSQWAGGGGGGGLGTIRVNTYTGQASLQGTVSGQFSQGKVTTTP